MKSFKQYIKESNHDHISHFINYACDHLGIEQPPKIHLIDNKKEASEHKSFGGYSPNDKSIKVNTAGRHPVDVMRTLAHELAHHKQDLENRITHNSGETGSDIENEANAKAGIIMRNYGKINPAIFENTDHRGALHAFDIDGTLMHTTAKVHVKDHHGKIIQSLSHDEYNKHKLQHGHHYDFSEFRSSDQFNKEKPIKPMLAKLKAIHKNVKSHPKSKVIMATARSNFDDKKKFLHHWRKHGVDIDNIRVERAGNIETHQPVAEKKAEVIRHHLKSGNYREAHLYDDDSKNLDHFLKLRKEFPHTTFHAHHVQPDGTSKKYENHDD
jgi:hypothetical protein